MDRFDERKTEPSTPDETGSSRTGDVLGLGSGPAPKQPGDPSADSDPESIEKRRDRLRATEDQGVSDVNPAGGAGATGVDMGSGGGGTDVSGD